MKALSVLVVCLILLMKPCSAGELGVGAMLGSPTGVNGKYWLNEGQAVDAGLGFAFGGKVSLHSDYLFHTKDAFYFNDVHPLDLYYGVGGRMRFADDVQMGLRVPVGLAHRMADQSADIFAELAPIFDFMPRSGMDLNIAFGARYYLK